jgi:hypothetical protein
VIARRLKRYFGIVAGPWTIEMPYLRTVQDKPMEIVLSRIMRKEIEDERHEEAQLRKHSAEVAGLVLKAQRGVALTEAERESVVRARRDATAVRQSKWLTSRTTRMKEKGQSRRKPK